MNSITRKQQCGTPGHSLRPSSTYSSFFLKHGAGGFVVRDALAEFAQVVVARGIELELLHRVVARVVEGRGIGGDGAVVGGEAGLERARGGEVGGDVPGRRG